MKSMKRKGVFLIFSLWVFLLLSIFCLGLGFSTYIQVKKIKLFINRARAFSLAVSGVKLARRVLEADEDAGVDHLQEDWAIKVEKEINFFSPKESGLVWVTIEDELARININKISEINEEIDGASDSILIKLFEAQGIYDTDEKVGYLLDYIDEDAQSRGFDSEKGEEIKNAPLSVVEEVLLVKNIYKDDYERIKNVFTVVGDGRININTVDKDMIEILIDDDEVKKQIFAVRFGSSNEKEDDGYYGEEEWQKLLEQLEEPLRRTLNVLFRINSEFFRVTSLSDVGGVKEKIICVVEQNTGIIYWYEK